MNDSPATPTRNYTLMNLAASGAIALLVLVILSRGEKPILLATAAMAGAVALPFLPWLAVPAFALIMGACFLMNDVPIHIGVRWYGADMILAFVATAGLIFLVHYLQRDRWLVHPKAERTIVLLLLSGFLYALVPLGYGLFVEHYAITDVMGDFRRFYVYPLALLIPLFLPIPAWQRDHLHGVFVTACLLILLMGAYRLATGVRWAEAIYSQATSEILQPRILSHTEAMNLTAASAYLAAAALTAKNSLARFLAVGLLAASTGLLIVCGWRLATIYALAVPVAVFLILRWLRKEPMWRLIATLTALAGAGAVVLAAMTALLPEMQQVLSKLIYRFQNAGAEGDSRYFSWRRAIEEWQDAPVMGKGLGNQLYYYFRASDGQFLAEFGSTHNLLLDLLYQTGIAGISLFLGVHVCFCYTVWRQLPRLHPEYHAVGCGLLAGYVANWGFALLQPLQVGAFLTLFLCMGFLLLLFRVSATRESD
ncbi:MAG: O-antigen ligase family protein [Candidatus Hydrogenedentes bacterium]|nr:O-antigen ligase family protein [Candidatus Hydrogenedentota bacterium]